MSNAEKFLQALGESEEIRAYIAEHALDEGMDKTDGLVAVAQRFGHDVSKEELEGVLAARREQIQAGAAAAEDAVIELTDEELSVVSGGLARDVCEDTYSSDGVFTCWTKDACMSTAITYWKYDKCAKSINPSCRNNVTQ